jgi:hypothetical protein
MRRLALAAALALANGAGGCGLVENSPTHDVSLAPVPVLGPIPNVTIRNVSRHNVPIIENPFTEVQTPVGAINAGETATAHCILVDSQRPENSEVLAEQGAQRGYVSLYTAAAKDKKPVPQIKPGVGYLRAALPPCILH